MFRIDSFFQNLHSILPFRRILTVIGVVQILVLSIFLTIRYLEHVAFRSRIEIKDLKRFLVYVVQNDMNKAVDLGILGFSIWDGVIIEDFSISSDEDFSFGKKLLESRKLVLKLSSVFSEKPYIRKIRFLEPKLSLDTKDPFFSKLVEYVLEAKVREVEFTDAQIEVFEGELPYLNWKGKFNCFFRRENGNIYFHFSNGSYWVPWAERIRGNGKFSIDTEKNINIFFQVEGKNLEARGFGGYLEKIAQISLTDGRITGSMRLEYNEKGWSSSVTYELQNAIGYFLPLETISFQNLNLNGRSEISGNKNQETLVQEFMTDAAVWKLAKKKESELYSGRFEWEVRDLSRLFRYLSLLNGWEIGGKIQGNLSWSETGVKNKWFLFEGQAVWEEGWMQREGFKLDVKKLLLSTEKSNILKVSFLGTLFHSPWNWDSELELQFRKSAKIDASSYYPVASKGSAFGRLREFRILDWEGFFHYLYESLARDRKERMEKLILKDNFTEFPVYRYLLEDMDFAWNFEIENMVFPDSSVLHRWLWSGSIRQGFAKTELYQKDSSNRIEFSSRFATKLPFLDFRMNLHNIPWGGRFSEFCGIGTVIDSFSVDFRGTGIGADTYNITQSAFISSEWMLKGWRPVYDETKTIEKIPDKGWDWRIPSDFNYNWSYSSENQYYRDMEWLRENGDYLKGSGTSTQNMLQYSFYGKKGNEFIRFSLVESDSSCQ